MVNTCFALAGLIALFSAVVAHIVDKAFLKGLGANLLGRFGGHLGILIWELIVTAGGLFGGFTFGLWFLSTLRMFTC